MSTAKQIFEYLPGIWKLTRQTITPLKQWEKSGAECIKGNGFAAFIPCDTDSNLLIYSEKITINIPDDDTNPMNGLEAKQKYKYRYDGIASTLTKYFFDDRLFYTLEFNSENSTADNVAVEASASSEIIGCGEHLCIQDLYVAKYSFKDQRNFLLKYTINGPKKCYEIINEYEKCDSNSAAAIENGEIV